MDGILALDLICDCRFDLVKVNHGRLTLVDLCGLFQYVNPVVIWLVFKSIQVHSKIKLHISARFKYSCEFMSMEHKLHISIYFQKSFSFKNIQLCYKVDKL